MKKKYVVWKQRINSVPPKYEIRNIRNRGGAASARDQLRTAKYLSWKIIDLKIGDIKELYIFPNDYEYRAVYDCLIKSNAEVVGEYGQDEAWIKILSNKLYKRCGIEKPDWALIKLGERKFFIATCGKGTADTTMFIGNCSNLFRKLKKVFIGGICGCPAATDSSASVEIGHILISSTYYWLQQSVIADGRNRDEDGEDKENIVEFKGMYFNKKNMRITVSPDSLELIKGTLFRIKETLSDKEKTSFNYHEGVNFTSCFFVNAKEAGDAICEALGTSNVAINMEDGAYALQCKKNSLEFCALRVVSDPAGFTPRKGRTYRISACKKLGEVFKMLMSFLAENPSIKISEELEAF